MKRNICINRAIALMLCMIFTFFNSAPVQAEDDWLLTLFCLAMMEEYGLNDVDELLDMLSADSMAELYEMYGDDWSGSRSGNSWSGGSDDVAYYDDEGYAVYLDEQSGFYYGLYDDDSAYIIGCQDLEYGYATDMLIPAYVEGYPVYDVYEYAFQNASGIGAVTVADGVERISYGAFMNSDIKSIEFPRSLTHVEYDAFSGCSSLNRVVFSEGLEYIGVNAFANCTSLQSAVLPNSVTEIDYDAFYNCSALETVHIGSGLKRMEGNMFVNTRIRNLSIAEGNRVFSIQDGIVYNTSKNSIVRYPGLLRQDTEFSVPDGITEVEYGCFADKNTLKRLILPDSVKTIGDYAFYGCDQCEYFGLGSGLSTLGYAAVPTNLLRGIQLPSSLTSLDDLSLYVWSDQPVAYDELWIVAYDGSPAARWAKEQGYSVRPPSEGALIAIGAMEEKKAVLTISPKISMLGETVVLDMQVQGYDADYVRFVVEGEDVGTADLIHNTAHYEFLPANEGVYTISALIGMETVAYVQMAVSGDSPMTIEKIPEDCYHEYAHLSMPEYVETTFWNAGLQNEHMKSVVAHEAWICSRCKAYCIEEEAIRTNNAPAPHELTLSGFCPCGLRITEGVSPVNEVPITDRILPNSVWCYTLGECSWFTAPGGAAAGSLPVNTAVEVMGFDSGYILTTIPGKNANSSSFAAAFSGTVQTKLPQEGEIAYIPAGYLALLPLEDPGKFGYHKDLTLDKVRLSQMPSEEALYEYYQDVRLWDSYLFDIVAYENSQFDSSTLRNELAVELYKNYDETMPVLGQMDLMVDVEALMKLDAVKGLTHLERSMHRMMPSLGSLKAFANIFGYQDYLDAYKKEINTLNKLVDFKELFDDGKEFYEKLSPDQKKAFDEFVDDIDDIRCIDIVEDFIEDLLEDISKTKIWGEIEPYVGGSALLTKYGLEGFDLLFPFLDVIFAAATLEDFFANLTPAQKAALMKLKETDDTYIAIIAEYALDSDILHEYLFDAIIALAIEKSADGVLETTLIGRVYKVSQGIFGLMMSDVANTAQDAFGKELPRYMAYETMRLGVSSVLMEQFLTLPAQPDADQLAELEALVNEYARLGTIAHPERSSSFAQLALQAISRCKLYEHAPSVKPEKPMLIRYQP